jgi:hypothetical protein
LFKDPIPQEYATMQEVTTTSVTFPSTSRDVLTEILRQGGQAMLTTAIESEVAQWIPRSTMIGVDASAIPTAAILAGESFSVLSPINPLEWLTSCM